MLIQNAALRFAALRGVRKDREIRLNAPNPWRGLKLYIHALRAVLKIPLPSIGAFFVAKVIAADESYELVMREQGAFAALGAAGKTAQSLRAVIPHPPLATRIQA